MYKMLFAQELESIREETLSNQKSLLESSLSAKDRVPREQALSRYNELKQQLVEKVKRVPKNTKFTIQLPDDAPLRNTLLDMLSADGFTNTKLDGRVKVNKKNKNEPATTSFYYTVSISRPFDKQMAKLGQ